MPTGEQARVFDARLLKPYRQSQLFEAIARVTSAQETAKAVADAAKPESRNQFILVADDNAVNLKVALAMDFSGAGRQFYCERGRLNPI